MLVENTLCIAACAECCSYMYIYSHFTVGKPEMEQLESFHAKGKDINIIEQMAVHYNSFGPKMLKDGNGTVVQGLWVANMGDPVRATRAILRKWLGGVGEQPATWNQLLKCLRHAQLNVVAQDVENALI